MEIKKKIILVFSLLVLILSILNLTFATDITEDMKDTANAMQNTAQSAGETIKEGAQNAGNTIMDSTEKAGNSVMNATNTTKDGIQNATNEVGNTLENMTTTENLTGDYNTTQTNADTQLTQSNNSTMWMWVMLAVVAVLIIGLVWYYAVQSNKNNH